MPQPAVSDDQRKRIAGTIARGAFPNSGWGDSIVAQVGNPILRTRLAFFCNNHVAQWVHRNFGGSLVFAPVQPGELAPLQTVGDFAVLMYHHLIPIAPAAAAGIEALAEGVTDGTAFGVPSTSYDITEVQEEFGDAS